MDVRNIENAPAFVTKDGSEIRELLAHRNSQITQQSLAEARLAVGARTTPHYHSSTEEIYYPGFPIWSWYPPPENRRRALIFLGSDARNPAAEGDTQWVNYKPSHFSSRSMGI